MYNEFTMFRRLETAVRACCRRRGLLGDPLADGVRPMGTLDEELICLDVLLDLPAEMRRCEAARPLVRAAVLSSPRGTERPETVHPAIARARGQAG